jgi:VWFA-related protein
MSFLKSGLAANDRVAILTISSGLVLPFTADKTALSGAIDKVVWRERKLDSVGCPLLKPYDSYLIANHLDQTALDVKAGELMVCQPGICGMSGGNRRGGGATTACAAAVRQVQAMANALWEEVRTQSLGIIRTLQNIVDLMARMNGARMVLLTSSGFLSGTLEADQDQIIDRALRANVVINSLDAKGLYTEDAPAMGMGAGVRSVIYAQSQGTRPKEESNEAMGNLADSTGGLFFHNSNDLDLGFRDLGMQPETSYLLGYSPDAPDGRYHRLKVSLTSKSHDNVQARKGYMAVVRPAEKPAPERRIDREVFGGSQWNDVPVTVAAEPAKLENGNPVARMAFVWDLAKMRFHLQDGIRSEKLHMVAALLDEQGNFVTGKEGVVEFALSESTFNRAVSAGFSISMSLEAPAGAYRLRTVVVEDGDEHASAATQAVVLK